MTHAPAPAAVLDPVESLLLDEALAVRPHGRRPVAIDVTSAATVTTLADRSPGAACGVWIDSLRVENDVAAGLPDGNWIRPRLDADLLAGADLVLLRMPRSIDALDEIAALVARHAAPDAVLLAGARVKYLTPRMTAVLERHFGSVRGSLGRQKSRVLVADGPRPPAQPEESEAFPRSRRHDDLQLTITAHGAAFAGSGIDLGTRILLEALRPPADVRAAADLGCGSGVLATALARRLPRATVHASDDTYTAVWSTTATAAANRVAERVTVRRADLLDGVPDASLDLVVCNPPFHRGPAKDSVDGFRMIKAAARALRPGGELWTVYNAHLPYLPTLRKLVGPTTIARRTDRYLVTRSQRA